MFPVQAILATVGGGVGAGGVGAGRRAASREVDDDNAVGSHQRSQSLDERVKRLLQRIKESNPKT